MESTAAARSTLIFDRQPLWLSALEQVLERNGFAVVATAVMEPHALKLLREHQPSVLVFEPEACMSAPTRFIEVALREVHGLKMIAVSQAEDSASITECLAAGVFAYVLKSAHPEDISLAARQAIHQSIHFAPGRAGTPHLSAVNSVRPASLDDGSELTRREREILALVAEGSSNGTVARKLWVTEQTVKFHLSNIYRKLGVSNRTAASRWAHDRGMLAAEHSVDSTPAAV
jgi:DNA-binding NarL/FixJ family response regulator